MFHWRKMQARTDWKNLKEAVDYDFLDATAQDAIVDIRMLTYNHESYIRHAIESVLMQKTKYKYRLLIGEDCSSDGTRAIIQEYQGKYPDRIAAIYWNRNVGMDCNGIIMAQHSRAKYVAFLEGDDYWTSPLKLERAVSFLEEHPEYVGFAHNVWQVDKDERMLHHIKQLSWNLPVREDQISCRRSFDNIHPRLLMSHTSTYVNRNYQVDWDEKMWNLWYDCRQVGDKKKELVMSLLGDVFISRNIMSAYRRVFDSDSWISGTYEKNCNFRSVMMWQDHAKLYRELTGEEYPALEGFENQFLQSAQEFVWGKFSLSNLGIYLGTAALIYKRRLADKRRTKGREAKC